MLQLSLACALAASLAACDTEKQPAPQGHAQSAATTESTGTTTARYRVDRSHAGSAIPDTVLGDPSDTQATLRQYGDKPLVLNLWATWCAPCIEELPTLQTIASEGGDRYRVVALSQDLQDAQTPRQFLKDHGATSLIPWHDPDNTVSIAYGQSLPTTVLFNSKGEEVLRVIGPLDWTGTVGRGLLAEAGIKPAP